MKFMRQKFLIYRSHRRVRNNGCRDSSQEAGNENIEMLKALIQKSFAEQRELISRLETVLEAMTSFNGKQMLDSRDMRLQLKVCDRTLIRWRNSGKLPYFKLSGKIYFWASDVYRFLREEYRDENPDIRNNKPVKKS